MTKILLVSTNDRGGAAKACLRLRDGLLDQEIDAKALLRESSRGTSPVHLPLGKHGGKGSRAVQKLRKKLWEGRNRRVLQGRNAGWDIFSFDDAPWDITWHPAYAAADVINLHWVADFVNLNSFFRTNTKKVVWTLHDMFPFTAGCHYAGACLQYREHCHACPQLDGTGNSAFVARTFDRKSAALDRIAGNSLAVVALSRWMFDCSRASRLLGRFEHRLIPNGLDTSVYRPLSREACRSMLGLPENRKIILFVGDDVGNARKGFRQFQEAVQRLQGPGSPLAVVIGRGAAELGEGGAFKVWGPVTDEHLMAMLYASAHVYVHAAMEDNLPNTVMESLMCGTPVAGFRIGGVSDMVREGVDGRLAGDSTGEALACAIQDVLLHEESFPREAIWKGAVQRYALEVQAQAYKALYEELLGR